MAVPAQQEVEKWGEGSLDLLKFIQQYGLENFVPNNIILLRFFFEQLCSGNGKGWKCQKIKKSIFFCMECVVNDNANNLEKVQSDRKIPTSF